MTYDNPVVAGDGMGPSNRAAEVDDIPDAVPAANDLERGTRNIQAEDAPHDSETIGAGGAEKQRQITDTLPVPAAAEKAFRAPVDVSASRNTPGNEGERKPVRVVDDEPDAVVPGNKDGQRGARTPPHAKKWRKTTIEQWEEARKLFVEKGITNIDQLAKITQITPAKIVTKTYREGWRPQRRKFLAEQQAAGENKDSREGEKKESDFPAGDLAEDCRSNMLKIGAKLMSKLNDHVQLFDPEDAKEIKGLIEGFSSLMALIKELLPQQNTGVDGKASQTAVQVNILAAAVDAADREKEARYGDLPE